MAMLYNVLTQLYGGGELSNYILRTLKSTEGLGHRKEKRDACFTARVESRLFFDTHRFSFYIFVVWCCSFCVMSVRPLSNMPTYVFVGVFGAINGGNLWTNNK